MLDQRHGRAALRNTADNAREPLGLVVIEAGRRLVDQKKRGIGSQCARDFQQALLDVGKERGGSGVGMRGQVRRTQ